MIKKKLANFLETMGGLFNFKESEVVEGVRVALEVFNQKLYIPFMVVTALKGCVNKERLFLF